MAPTSHDSTKSLRLPFVQCLHVVKSGIKYADVLRDIELTVFKGEIVCILGASSSGKTALVKLLLGLESPDEGQVVVGGISPASLHSRDVALFRRQVGVVFQDLKLLMRKTVFENVSFPLVLAEKPREYVENKTRQSLRDLGLERKIYAKCFNLSRCEQQLVAVARATVHDPVFLLADEPAAHLEEDHALRVADHLNALNIRGTTVIILTRDAAFAGLMKHGRTLSLNQGRIMEIPPTGQQDRYFLAHTGRELLRK
ncbi:MAG: ATP-binding cassette domain-containing protein [Deltaproteobacteria bacterium]|nr:ATP-binding cassette domain-containing protein [Deltaproteobacteria bacterium]